MNLRTLNPDYKKRISKMLEGQRFMHLIDLQLSSIEIGKVIATLEIQDQHHQQNGLLHGGVISTAADVAMGFAAVSLVSEEQLVLTGEMKVSYLNPGDGEKLEAVGTVLKPGRRINFCEAEVYSITGSDRTLIAKASSSMITINEADISR